MLSNDEQEKKNQQDKLILDKFEEAFQFAMQFYPESESVMCFLWKRSGNVLIEIHNNYVDANVDWKKLWAERDCGVDNFAIW